MLTDPERSTTSTLDPESKSVLLYTRPASSRDTVNRPPIQNTRFTDSPILNRSRVLAPCHFVSWRTFPSSLACESTLRPTSWPPCSHCDTSAHRADFIGSMDPSTSTRLLAPCSPGPPRPIESRTLTSPLPRSPTQECNTKAEVKRTPKSRGRAWGTKHSTVAQAPRGTGGTRGQGAPPRGMRMPR